ncbi:hypothetical protein BFP78_00245 [Gaetbulibacter sp. 5U11]|nr:hypothetical protein BFP78_00245 [Gaetbulibacter sp. 5U11]
MSNLKKITPFLIIGILSIVFAIYKWIFDSNGLGMISVYLLFIVGIIALLFDFGFRKWLKTFKKIAFTELIIIGILISANQYKYHRTKTLEIPTDLNNKYVTIIYGVNGQPELEITDFTLTKNIVIPDNGILMTSTEYEIDLPKTKIKTTDNEYFKTKESNMTFGQFGGKLNHNDKVYKFRSWQIGEKENCCSHTGEEMKIYRTELKKELINKASR